MGAVIGCKSSPHEPGARLVTSTSEIRNRTCLVTLEGEFDRTNVGELRAEIKACLERAFSVLLDFGAVTFIDGSVLSLLLDVLGKLQEGGSLGVARPLPRIERLLGVAGLTDRSNFRIFSTLNEALKVVDRD
jgi:anti-anti-sigma factor